MEFHTLVSPYLHVEISHQSANKRPHWTQHVEAQFLKFIPSPSRKITFCLCQGSVLGHPCWKNLYIQHFTACQIQEKLRKRENSKTDHNIEKVFSYFPGYNKLALCIQFSHSLIRDAIVLVFGDKFLLRIAFRGLGFPRNTCLSLRISFGLDPNLECVKVSSSTNLSKSFEASFKIKELPKRFSHISKFSRSLTFQIF